MKNFTKKSLLLIAAILITVTAAWADDEYSLIYGRSTTADEDNGISKWSDTDVADWGGSVVIGDNGLGLESAGSASKKIEINENSKVKYEISWYAKSTGNKKTAYSYLKMGNLWIRFYDNYNKSKLEYSTGGTTDGEYTSLFASSSQDGTARGGATLTVYAIFDTSIEKLDTLSVTLGDNSYSISDISDISDANVLGLQTVKGNYQPTSELTSVSVWELEQAVTTTSYTIYYKDTNSGNIVKTVIATGVIDQVVTADSVIDADGSGKHYLLVDDEAPSMTLVSGENTLTVNVRSPYTATLSEIRTIGGVEQDAIQTVLTETDDKDCSYTWVYPVYVLSDGSYYKVTADSVFGSTGTFSDGEEITKTLTYKLDKYVVYYHEGEDIDAGLDTTLSNGGSGYVAAQNYRNRGVSTTLSAGSYQFYARFTAANGRGLAVRDGSSTESATDPLALLKTTRNADITNDTASFVLDSETLLYINGANSGTSKSNQSETFDYCVILKATSAPDTDDLTVLASAFAQAKSSLSLYEGSVPNAVYTLYAASANSLTPTTAEEYKDVINTIYSFIDILEIIEESSESYQDTLDAYQALVADSCTYDDNGGVEAWNNAVDSLNNLYDSCTTTDCIDSLTVKIAELYTEKFLAGIDSVDNAYDVLVCQSADLLNDPNYLIVTGQERSNLEEALSSEPTTDKQIASAITVLEEAIEAFTSAKDSYEEYDIAVANAENIGIQGKNILPLTNAALLRDRLEDLNYEESVFVNNNYAQNSSYSVAALSKWTATSGTSYKGQHWSGDETVTYYGSNGLTSSSWTTSYTTTVTLDEGFYVLKVAARGGNNNNFENQVEGRVYVSEDGETVNFYEETASDEYSYAHVAIDGDGSCMQNEEKTRALGIDLDGNANFYFTNSANNGLGYGWKWVFLPLHVHNDATSVTYNLWGSAKSKANWINFSDVELLTLTNVLVGIEDAARSDLSKKDIVYDLSGRRVETSRTSTLPKGIYIVNGKKIVK